MSAWDKIYCELCENILTNGVQVANRTGIDTIKLPSAHFQLNVGEEFPILTTKQLFIRQAVLEMLWIYQAQSMMFDGFRNAMCIYGIFGKLMKTEIGVMKNRRSTQTL